MNSYAYAVGKIRALEKRLLPKSHLERVAETPLEGVATELKDTVYFRESIGEKGLFSLLRNERRVTYDLTEKLLENSSLSTILRLRCDIHNLKLLLKKEIDSSISTDFSPSGAISPPLLEKAIHNKAFLQIPFYFREIAKKSIALFQAEGIKQLEQFLEKEMWKIILSKSKEIKNIFLEEFLKMQIDFLNIKNFPDIFIPGGKLRKELFKEEKSVLEKKILLFYPRLDPEDLEKSTDNLLTDYLKKAKTYSFGIEPLIAYLFAKESEAKNIKLLLLGKLNNINPSILKENLRETYA